MRSNKHDKPTAAFFAALVEIGRVQVSEAAGVSEEVGTAVMRAICDELVNRYGRRSFYIPAVHLDEMADRDQAILERWVQAAEEAGGSEPFTMRRLHDIAVEYQLTERSIYKAIERARQREAGCATKVGQP